VKWRPSGGLTDAEVRALVTARERVPRAQDAVLAAITPGGQPAPGVDLALGADDLLAAWAPGRAPEGDHAG
jgi:hypothetical protein